MTHSKEYLEALDVYAERAQDTLYHYTDSAALLGIVQEHAIRATDHAFTNDPRELGVAFSLAATIAAERLESPDLTDAQRNWLRPLTKLHRPYLTSHCYVACFSADSDVLSQWRAYAADGFGFALGFDRASLADAVVSRASTALVCVEYDEAKQRELVTKIIEEGLASLDSRPRGVLDADTFPRLGTMSTVVKQAAFREERERRLLVFKNEDDCELRAGKTGLVPFLSLPLRRDRPFLNSVVIGPRQDPQAAWVSLYRLFHSVGWIANPTLRLWRKLGNDPDKYSTFLSTSKHAIDVDVSEAAYR